MQDLQSPRKVLVLEDDRRTMYWLITAAISRADLLEVVWARTLEEAIDALRFYDDQLAIIALGDVITDGPTVDFARQVKTSDFGGMKIRFGDDSRIGKKLEAAGFPRRCTRFELPSCLLNLITLYAQTSPFTSLN